MASLTFLLSHAVNAPDSVSLPSSMNQSVGGYWSLNVIAVLHKPALLLSPCRSVLYSQLKERVLRIFLHLFIWAARARMRIAYLQLNAQQMITSARFEQLNIVTGVGAHLCTMILLRFTEMHSGALWTRITNKITDKKHIYLPPNKMHWSANFIVSPFRLKRLF